MMADKLRFEELCWTKYYHNEACVQHMASRGNSMSYTRALLNKFACVENNDILETYKKK